MDQTKVRPQSAKASCDAIPATEINLLFGYSKTDRKADLLQFMSLFQGSAVGATVATGSRPRQTKLLRTVHSTVERRLDLNYS
jgi:hypothetical protein